jgi:hypothetical protein
MWLSEWFTKENGNQGQISDEELICVFRVTRFCMKIYAVFHSLIQGIEKKVHKICTIRALAQSIRN